MSNLLLNVLPEVGPVDGGTLAKELGLTRTEVYRAARLASALGSVDVFGSPDNFSVYRRAVGTKGRWDLDFNNDGVVDHRDVEAFFDALAGAEVPGVDSLDFDKDDVYPSDADTFAMAMANQESGGWTRPTWANSMQELFVSARTGDDANSGSTNNPVRSITRAMQLAARPSEHRGVTIYLEPGTYQEEITQQYDGISWGGASHEKPIVIRPWDRPGSSGVRPRIVPRVGRVGLRLPGDTGFIQLHGLHFIGNVLAPQGAAVMIQGNARGLFMEDCVMDGFTAGLVAQGMGGGTVYDVTMRRCLTVDTRNPVSHSQGSFVSQAEVRYLQSAFINCGNRDTYCQGIYGVYCVSPADLLRVVEGCFFDSPGFCGIQARGNEWRTRYNVFNECGNGIGVGHPMAAPHGVYNRGTHEDNLVVDPVGPSWGLAVQGMDGTIVRRNAVLQVSRPWQGAMLVRDNGSMPSLSGSVVHNRGYGVVERYFRTPVAPGEVIEANTVMDELPDALKALPARIEEISAALRIRLRGEWRSEYDMENLVRAVQSEIGIPEQNS